MSAQLTSDADSDGISAPAFIPFVKHLTPDWAMFRLPGRPLLAVRVNESAFGRLILDIATSLQVARRDGADVYFMPLSADASKYRVNETLFALECEGTRIIRHDSVRGRLARGLWHVRNWAKRRIEPHAGALFPKSRNTAGTTWRTTFRRQLFARAIPAALPAAQREHADRAFAELGLNGETPIVTIHLRDPSHDAGDNLSKSRIEAPSRRNTTVSTYIPAIDYLASKGFRIVRLGASHDTVIDHPAVIDLSAMEKDRPLLEVAALFRSRFFICSDSGPMLLPLLTGTPSLLTNGTHWACQYPLKENDIYLLKPVRNNATGHILTSDEMFEKRFVADGYTDKYTFVENDPEDILDAVKEMENILLEKSGMSSEQQLFKAKCEEFGAFYQESDELPTPVRNVFRKWASDNGFMGHGRIAAAFLKRINKTNGHDE